MSSEMESRSAMVARMFHEGDTMCVRWCGGVVLRKWSPARLGSSEREGGSGAGARGRGRSSRGRARSGGGGVRDRRQVQQAGDRDRLARRRRRRRRRPGPGVGGLRTGVGPHQGRRAVGRRDRSHQRRRRVRGRRPRARARALRGRRAATGLRRGGGGDEGLRCGQVVRAAEARRELRAVVPDAPVERALERPEPLEGRGPVWISTSELGYPEKYCVELREPPRHRADVATGTMSRRWRGIATPSRRRSYGKHVASMAWGARNLISTQPRAPARRCGGSARAGVRCARRTFS